MTAFSDISLNGTVVSWVPNDDTSFDVSCTYEDGSGFVFSDVTDSFFELSGAMDITRNIDVVVTGTPSNTSLTISYNAPPWVFTRLSGGNIGSVIVSMTTIGSTVYATNANFDSFSRVISYNSSSNAWTDFTEVMELSGLSVISLTSMNGVLYGSYIDISTFDTGVVSYDGSVWTKHDAESVASAMIIITTIGSTVYVGGVTIVDYIPFVISYDSSNQVWTNLSGGALGDMSSGIVYSLTEVSGVLYAGGLDIITDTPFVMSYDGFAKRWTNLSGGELGDITNGVVYSLTEVSGVLYAGGGNNATLSAPFVMSYDSSNQVWTNLSGGALGFISDGYVNSLTEVNGTLYAGGQNNTNNRPFVMSYDSSNQVWTNLSRGDLVMSNGIVNSLTDVNGVLYAGGQENGIGFIMSYGPPPHPAPLSDISLNGTILNWNPNDDTTIVMTITMNGTVVFFSATESSPFDLSGNVDTTQVLSIVLTGTPSSASLNVQYNPPQPPSPPAQVPCFLENAPVLTPSGYKKISKLVAGDLVMTGDGRSVPIQSVVRKHVAAGPSTNPYVIPKGLYGATKRLLISPNHCVATSKGMVEARLLGLEQENMTGSIHYYNLELPSWAKDTMVVAGVTVESLAPVRRVRLSIDQFKAKLVRQYGKITPEILAKVERTCRIVDGGYVEFPALIRKDTESNPNTFTK